MTSAADTLAQAAMLIATDGHLKGDYSRYGLHCAAGAIARVLGGGATLRFGVDYGAALCLLREELQRDTLLSELTAVATWNDAPETTADEVIDTMLRAAGVGEAI